MYGKTLEDYPERFDMFLKVFERTRPEVLDGAFEKALEVCKEFPTPADVKPLVPSVIAALEAKEVERLRIEEKRKIESGELIHISKLFTRDEFKAALKKAKG